MTAQSRSNPSPLLSPRPSRRRRWLRLAIVGAVVVVAALLSVLALRGLVLSYSPRTHQLDMVTDLVPRRVLLAEQIRDEASRHGLDVVLTSRQFGSLEALEEIDAPSEIKLALTPGGVKARDYPAVRLVTTLTTEPLHVLVRPELAAKGLSTLRGRRVAIGPPTMASHHMAREVLAFAGLRPTAEAGADGYAPVTTSAEELSREASVH